MGLSLSFSCFGKAWQPVSEESCSSLTTSALVISIRPKQAGCVAAQHGKLEKAGTSASIWIAGMEAVGEIEHLDLCHPSRAYSLLGTDIKQTVPAVSGTFQHYHVVRGSQR